MSDDSIDSSRSPFFTRRSWQQLSVRLGAGLALLGLTAMAAVAQPAATLKSPAAAATDAKKTVVVILTQSRVVRATDGTEKFEDASTVKPGDIIEYRATYTNNVGKAVTGLVADLPIPQGLEYLPKSAKPAADLVKAATDNGVYAAEPLTRKVDGKTQNVPYSEYRSLRWSLGQLPVNGVTAVTARARVEVVVPPEPKTSPSAAQAPPGALQPAVSR